MTRLFSNWTLMTFVLTVMSSPLWPPIPGWGAVWSTVIFVVVSSVIPRLRVCVGMAIAVLLILTHCQLMRVQKHVIFQSESPIWIEGRVNQVFASSQSGFRGPITITAINHVALSWWQRPTIKLFSPIRVYPGQQVQFSVTIKPIYGQLNEVGFDYEKYAISQGWVAQGRVTSQGRYQILTHYSLLSTLYQRVSLATHNSPAQGLILALLFGDRSLLSTEQWQALRNSGLSHLVAISGLHIGIAFGFGFLLAQLLSRFHPSLLWTPWWVGLSMASGYAWLAGFTLPTLRALLMCLTMVAILRLRLHVTTLWRLLFILSSVLVVDPFASYSSSFWLSFSAVIVILYLTKRPTFPVRWWWQMLWLQAGISLLMLPISIGLFHGVSYVSLLFNLIFIPWFSYIVMPLLFMALVWLVLSLPGYVWLLQLAEQTLSPVLTTLHSVPSGWLSVSDTMMWVVVGGLVVWRSRDWLRGPAIAALLTIFMLAWFHQPKLLQWRMDVLDVGHGLAILIQQGNRALVFDTGASWQGGSIAQSVILPILAKRGIALDSIVISHMDDDHAGGLSLLQREAPDARVYTSQSLPSSQACLRGMNWWWGSLSIEVLWPPKRVTRAYNQHSCVVRVRDMYGHSVLMTGDVEAVGEWLLVRNQSHLTSQVMVVPHHGSATSSTQQLIKRVSPKWALASINKGNRWRLPSPHIVKRYQQSGATWLDTGSAGQISVFFHPNDMRIMTKRLDDNHRWYRQMLRNGLE